LTSTGDCKGEKYSYTRFLWGSKLIGDHTQSAQLAALSVLTVLVNASLANPGLHKMPMIVPNVMPLRLSRRPERYARMAVSVAERVARHARRCARLVLAELPTTASFVDLVRLH
jgi:hypothetical protein